VSFLAVAVALILTGVITPSGPAGASTATLSKTSNMHFYERVTVHTGEAPGNPVLIYECFDADGTAFDRCVPNADTNVPASGDVDVVLMRRLESRNPTDGTAVFNDCLAAGTSCHVSVNATSGTTNIPVTFDPTTPVPVLSVTPNSSLGWSTAATVHGSGFLAGQEMMLTQCARVTPTAEARCVGAVYSPHATADSTGAFTFPIKVRRLVGSSPFDPRGAVDCAHVDCFVRAVLPPRNREDRVSLYGKGAVDTALDIADDGIPIPLIREITRQTEGHLPEVEINVDLMAPATSPLTITYSTGDAPPGSLYPSAAAGSDYIAKLSHHLYFLPGETHHEVRIAIVDDEISEPVEQFAVNYGGYFHANTRTSVVNIANDDH